MSNNEQKLYFSHLVFVVSEKPSDKKSYASINCLLFTYSLTYSCVYKLKY